jgi:hypothetical protein
VATNLRAARTPFTKSLSQLHTSYRVGSYLRCSAKIRRYGNSPNKAKKPGRLLDPCGSSTLLQGTLRGALHKKKLRGVHKFNAGIATKN